jgi:DNA primase
MSGALKTSGAKGLHIVVPLAPGVGIEDAAAATRAVAVRCEQLEPQVTTAAFLRADRGGRVFVDSTRAGGATLVAVYSPRLRPGMPVSFPVAWADLDAVNPADFTVRTAVTAAGNTDPWANLMPPPQPLDPGLVEQGHQIPVPRVAAMHEGLRRARARRGQ